MALDPNAAAPADSGVFGLDSTEADALVVLLPVPWDATTSYRAGTANGPAAILEASRQVDLFDVETGRPYAAGIVLVDEDPDVRAWNHEARALAEPILAAGGRIDGDKALGEGLARVNALGAAVNDRVYAATKQRLDAGKIVGLVGGDHASPFGAIRAYAERYPGLGILHVDAHADLRRAYEGFEWSHASIMENVARKISEVSSITQVAIRDLCEEEHDRIRSSNGRIRTHYDVELAADRMAAKLEARFRTIAESLPKDVYVSFDVDGLDPVLCPNTGTPVPGGLSFQEANALLRAIVQSGRTLVGFDLNEVAPDPSGADEWDANVGARVLYKLIGWTLRSREGAAR